VSSHHKKTHDEQAAHERMEAAAQGTDGSGDEAVLSDPPNALGAITSERDQLAADKAELQDRYLRLQAEFQNARRRAEKDRAEFAEYASTEAVRALLPILDDFERALKTEAAGKEFAKGMELIYQRLFESLKKLGLEPLSAAGTPFDPHIHHAVEMVESEETADNTVIDEYQRGYNFKGRLLRPAMVRVAVEPASRKA
jgi:molecular chaperone GrpE